MTWCSGFGALLVFVTMIPQVPWRQGASTAYFGTRFPKARGYGPLTAQDNLGKPMMWSSFRSKVCKKALELKKPNPVAQGVGMLGSMLGAGASVSGCAGWQSCKIHTDKRCSAYGTMMGIGIFVVLSQIISVVGAVVTPLLSMWETLEPTDAKERKARKKMTPQEYGNYTMVASMITFGFSFVPWALWCLLSGMTFRGLQEDSYYPYPAASAGMYLGAVANIFLGITMYCGITRIYPLSLWKKKEPEEEEVQEEVYGTAHEAYPGGSWEYPGAFPGQQGAFPGQPGAFPGQPPAFGGPPGHPQ